MLPFFSTRTHTKSQAAARMTVCLFALLFLLCACFSALPSPHAVTAFFTEYGLAGYGSASDNPSAAAHEAALKQFSDNPSLSQAQTEAKPPISTPITAPDKLPV